MNLLLHCCCAPCSVAVIENLASEGINPHLFWYNPNIHPYNEYKSRLDCLYLFADNKKLKLTPGDDYDLHFYLKEVFPEIDVPGQRCKTCYKMRLEKAASFAAQEGFSAFTSTLLISPYQDHDNIKLIAEEISAKYCVDFFYRDFRSLFRQGQQIARTKKMYMQKYCGCVFSEEERYTKNLCQRHKGTELCFDDEPPSSVSLCLREKIFNRILLITGSEGLKKLSNTSVLIFGAGGVGSWAAEALVRSGIGKIGIIDNDIICPSNINRQIEATTLSVGLPKATTLKNRLLEINPDCDITSWDELFCRENSQKFDIKNADYVIDAIDSLKHKLDLIEITCSSSVKLFSSMGMALKMDPSKIKAASIWKTDVCPLARLVRQGLRKRANNIDFTVVYSDELPLPGASGKDFNGSMVTVTASAGLMLASLVIQEILKNEDFLSRTPQT
jgi:hypothetical protein